VDVNIKAPQYFSSHVLMANTPSGGLDTITSRKGRRLAMFITTWTLMLRAQGSANESGVTRILHQQKRR
jgi:hypothetical protein